MAQRGWMSDKEMRAILEISSPGHAKGIILGKTEKEPSFVCRRIPGSISTLPSSAQAEQ